MADLNKEVVRAHVDYLNETAAEVSKAELAERLGLVKSGQDELVLPQAFLTVSKDGKVLDRTFLGHY